MTRWKRRSTSNK